MAGARVMGVCKTVIPKPQPLWLGRFHSQISHLSEASTIPEPHPTTARGPWSGRRPTAARQSLNPRLNGLRPLSLATSAVSQEEWEGRPTESGEGPQVF